MDGLAKEKDYACNFIYKPPQNSDKCHDPISLREVPNKNRIYFDESWIVNLKTNFSSKDF